MRAHAHCTTDVIYVHNTTNIDTKPTGKDRVLISRGARRRRGSFTSSTRIRGKQSSHYVSTFSVHRAITSSRICHNPISTTLFAIYNITHSLTCGYPPTINIYIFVFVPRSELYHGIY